MDFQVHEDSDKEKTDAKKKEGENDKEPLSNPALAGSGVSGANA